MSALRVWVLKNDETRDLRSVVTERDEDYDAEFLAHHAGSYTEHVALPVAEFEAMRRELEALRAYRWKVDAEIKSWHAGSLSEIDQRCALRAIHDATRNVDVIRHGGGGSCRYCGRGIEGTISFAIEHERECVKARRDAATKGGG